jgi:hypothetical protein
MKKAFLTVPLVVVVFLASPESAAARNSAQTPDSPKFPEFTHC